MLPVFCKWESEGTESWGNLIVYIHCENCFKICEFLLRRTGSYLDLLSLYGVLIKKFAFEFGK